MIDMVQLILIYMNKLLNNWIFINFCGQKIGQFDSNYVIGSLINALSAQITMIVNIPLFICYFSFGFRSFIPLAILIIISLIVVRKSLKAFLKDKLNNIELEKKYKFTTKRKRILYFILSIIMVFGSFLMFGYSLVLIQYFVWMSLFNLYCVIIHATN